MADYGKSAWFSLGQPQFRAYEQSVQIHANFALKWRSDCFWRKPDHAANVAAHNLKESETTGKSEPPPFWHGLCLY